MTRLFRTLIVAAGLALFATPAAAYCGIEALAGIGSAQTNASLGGSSINGIGGQGAALGVGAGCDLRIDQNWIAGVGGRIAWSDVKTSASIGGTSVSAAYDQIWSLYGRIGYQLTPSTLIYGLGGYSGATLDLGGIPLGLPNPKLKGLMLGVGTEVALGAGWLAKIEYDYHKFGRETVGPVALDANIHVVMVGIKYAIDPASFIGK